MAGGEAAVPAMTIVRRPRREELARAPLTRGCRRSAPLDGPDPLPEMDDRAGEGPGDAVDRLYPRDHQLAELVEVAGLGADDHVVGAGDSLGLLHAGDVDDLRGDPGRLRSG
jgi:hypothetical protein